MKSQSLASGVLVLLASPLSSAGGVVLNQSDFAHIAPAAGADPSGGGGEREGAVGRATIIETGPDRPAEDVCADVLRRVLLAATPRATVFPSEQYFYFEFWNGPELLRGNLRFTDARDGVLHVGVFDHHNSSRLWFTSFSRDDGVVIESAGRSSFVVSTSNADGVRPVEFVLDRTVLDREWCSVFSLAADEEVVSGILDESGFALTLIWDDRDGSFYYALDPETPTPGPLERIDHGPLPAALPAGSDDFGFLFHRASRWVFLEHKPTGTAVLVAVPAFAVEWNTYFDGPFDQVPPRLPLREKLERAYPYVKSRGGVDEHGNFLELDGQRVAISPHMRYEHVTQLAEAVRRRLDDLPSDAAFAELRERLTYERKRDFRPRRGGDNGPMTIGDLVRSEGHAVWMSQGWPPNHARTGSDSWPRSHLARASSAWPPNHIGTVSGSRETRPDTRPTDE